MTDPTTCSPKNKQLHAPAEVSLVADIFLKPPWPTSDGSNGNTCQGAATYSKCVLTFVLGGNSGGEMPVTSFARINHTEHLENVDLYAPQRKPIRRANIVQAKNRRVIFPGIKQCN